MGKVFRHLMLDFLEALYAKKPIVVWYMVEIVANCKKFIFINTQLSNIVMLDTCISLCVYECSCCICVNVCICELVLILVLGIFIFFLISVNLFRSVLRHFWLGIGRSIQPVDISVRDAGVVICLEQGADDLRMVKLPWPPILLASLKSRMVYLSHGGLLVFSWKRNCWMTVIVLIRVGLLMLRLAFCIFLRFVCF